LKGYDYELRSYQACVCGYLGYITNRVRCVLIFHTCGAGPLHLWCRWYAPHVRRINTIAVYGRV